MPHELAIADGAVALAPPMPWISPQHPLWLAFEDTVNPHPDVGQPKSYPPAIREAAQAVLDGIERYAVPVPEQVLRAWLAPIPLVVRNEKTPEALAGWLAGVALAIGHLEVGAFNASTQREALQTFQFFPSAADITAIVAPVAVEIRQRVNVLRRIVANGETSP